MKVACHGASGHMHGALLPGVQRLNLGLFLMGSSGSEPRYVSLDAPDATTLRDVGRPLFRDYWDRLRRSLAVLHEKHPKQRTPCLILIRLR